MGPPPHVTLSEAKSPHGTVPEGWVHVHHCTIVTVAKYIFPVSQLYPGNTGIYPAATFISSNNSAGMG